MFCTVKQLYFTVFTENVAVFSLCVCFIYKFSNDNFLKVISSKCKPSDKKKTFIVAQHTVNISVSNRVLQKDAFISCY